MFVVLFVSTDRLSCLKARVQCTFVIDRSLSKHHLHTQVKGSNFTLLEAYVIDVMCGSYFHVKGSNFTLLEAYVIDVMCGSYFHVKGSNFNLLVAYVIDVMCGSYFHVKGSS